MEREGHVGEDAPEESGGEGWGKTLRVAGAVGGLGVEFAVFVVVGAFVGRWLDDVLGTKPWLVLICVLASMALMGAHVRYLLGRAKRAR